jgi:hypothetical protein
VVVMMTMVTITIVIIISPCMHANLHAELFVRTGVDTARAPGNLLLLSEQKKKTKKKEKQWAKKKEKRKDRKRFSENKEMKEYDFVKYNLFVFFLNSVFSFFPVLFLCAPLSKLGNLCPDIHASIHA